MHNQNEQYLQNMNVHIHTAMLLSPSEVCYLPPVLRYRSSFGDVRRKASENSISPNAR